MKHIVLAPLTEASFKNYRSFSISNYAKDVALARDITSEEAMTRAEQSIQKFLPLGIQTPNHFLYTIQFENQKIGYLWWGKDENGSAWIYDIYLEQAFRGQGLGRATLAAFEKDAKSKGYTKMGLHVFAHNKNAHALYLKFGLRETGIAMQKEFG